MSTFNKVILTGRLTKDLIFKELENETFAVGRLATNDFWTDKEGITHQEVDYHNLVFKSNKAQLALDKLHKNDSIYVDGKVKYRKWIGADDLERWTYEVIVSSFRVVNKAS